MNPLILTLTNAAHTMGLSPALLLSLCFQESGLQNIITPHDGHSASFGVCQVKYGTAKLVEKTITISQLMNPEVNARIAAKYLKRQINRYKGNVFCAVNAYNRGRSDNCANAVYTKYVRKIKSHLEHKPWLLES